MSQQRIVKFVPSVVRPVSLRPEVQKVIDAIYSIDDQYDFGFEYDDRGQLIEPTDDQLLDLEQTRDLMAELDMFYRVNAG